MEQIIIVIINDAGEFRDGSVVLRHFKSLEFTFLCGIFNGDVCENRKYSFENGRLF